MSEHQSLYDGIARYINYLLSKKSLKPSTTERKVRIVKSLLKNRVDLSNPDDVVKFLNVCSWASGTKDIAIHAYRDYLDMLGLTTIQLPKIRREDKLPFIPLENELDATISYARCKTCSFLRVLKDTAVRPVEAWRLKWLDIDIVNRCVTITPAKYSRSRVLKISEQTLNMLLSLPRKNEYVFSVSGKTERFTDELEHFTRNYNKMRRRVAKKLQNPRIKLISLKTFRHWKATMEYIRTKDILHVKEMLGHVNINNTLKYIHLANAITQQNDEFVCKVAQSVNDAKELIESGFDYVTDINGLKLFKKRK